MKLGITVLGQLDSALTPPKIHINTSAWNYARDSRVRGNLGLLCTLLSRGIYIHDLASGNALYDIQLKTSVTLFNRFNSGALVFIDKEGNINRMRSDKNALVGHVGRVLRNDILARDISNRDNIPPSLHQVRPTPSQTPAPHSDLYPSSHDEALPEYTATDPSQPPLVPSPSPPPSVPYSVCLAHFEELVAERKYTQAAIHAADSSQVCTLF